MDSHTIGLFDPHAGTAPAIIAYDEDDDAGEAALAAPASSTTPHVSARNTRLSGGRPLARGWRARAERNVDLLRLARGIEDAGREATEEERAALLCFTGFGASELAQNAFPLPGLTDFREGREAIGSALRTATEGGEYAALQRVTQYAHYTPEAVDRAMWRAALHPGFRGGRVVEPGCGTGLLLALVPEEVADACRFTGVETCPSTARIARLVHPAATIRCEDDTRSRLGGGFDLVLGNPPFSRRVIRSDPGSPHPPLALHDHFIAASVRRLRPGAVAILVNSIGTLDKPDPAARQHIATMADLLAAVRLPAGAFYATASTEVVVDVLVLRRRADDETPVTRPGCAPPRSPSPPPMRRSPTRRHSPSARLPMARPCARAATSSRGENSVRSWAV